MTYTEVKAKYTTIESIDNRFKEIENIEKVGAERYRAASVTYLNEVNEVLKKFNVTDYHCHRANSRNITFLQEENNIFYEIDICAAYEYNWNKIDKPEKTWKFKVNVSSFGGIELINPDEKECKTLKYYSFIGFIINNNEFKKELNEVCHRNVNNLESIDKEYRFSSEERQLRILRNNLVKEATYGKILASVMDVKDKTQLVIIKKNVSEDEADGVRRGQFIKVMSEPLPNTLETRPEVDKKLKEIAKTNEGKFILTQIRFIKLNKE